MAKGLVLLLFAACATLPAVLAAPTNDVSTTSRDLKASSIETRHEGPGITPLKPRSAEPMKGGPFEHPFDARDEQFLNIHLDCGGEMTTQYCRDVGYHCGYSGLRTKNGPDILCHNCGCYDNKHQPYRPPFLPYNPLSPPFRAKSDDADHSERRDEGGLS